MTINMKSRRLKVAFVADVSVGYGTPQILRMAESFARVFGAEVHIFEPDQSERPPIDIRDHIPVPNVDLTRVYTTSHPYLMHGRIEFCSRVAKLLRAAPPNILVFSAMYGIQILDLIEACSILKIFYCLEEADTNYNYLFPLVRRCDVHIFPEENRHRIYSQIFGSSGDGRSSYILYNSNNRKEWVDPGRRLPRLFYGGTFHKTITLAEYFLKEPIIRMPIDIYGIIDGFKDRSAVAGQLNGHEGGALYRGYQQSNSSYFDILSRYLYSVVIWNPDREDRLYACPNKFFDAIACGVPPIAAPHPQCIDIIKEWNCGILMDDWSFDSLQVTLARALKAAGSDYYRELAFNCHRAMAEELSWERQFTKLVPTINEYLARKGMLV